MQEAGWLNHVSLSARLTTESFDFGEKGQKVGVLEGRKGFKSNLTDGKKLILRLPGPHTHGFKP